MKGIELDGKSRVTLEFVRLFEYIESVSEIIGEEKAWEVLKDNILKRRIRWLKENRKKLNTRISDLDKAREIFILKLGAKPEELAVIKRESNRIVLRSNNFCPILTACKILKWNPERICKLVCESAARGFLSKINPRLRFEFTKTRPRSEYCEEVISLE